jgi:hypothetical protein
MCADIHDGQEHKRSVEGPDTEAQDQSSPDHHIRLATHGRSKRAKTGSDKPYSITSSARARRDAGTSRPSDFVVLRLMTSAYLEGCSIVLLENAWAWKTSTWLTWRKARFFILACAFLYGLTVFLFAIKSRVFPAALAIDLDQQSDFSRREYAGYLCNFMGEKNVSSCSIRSQAEPRN